MPQNDPGINGSGHFSTYMKARIFCEREVPPGRQFNGAVDYHYNEIRKLVNNIMILVSFTFSLNYDCDCMQRV